MIFKIQSTIHTNKYTYAGVLEFTAEEGVCILPDWMFENLKFFEGCMTLITLE